MNIKIGNKTIGDSCPPFVIAEIGQNHMGEMKLAKQLIDAAIFCGVDAVKFQKRDIEAAFTKEVLDKPYCGPQSFGNTYREHRNALEFSESQFLELSRYCEEKEIIFFSTVFDIPSADFINSLNVPVIKISSFDLTNIPLLEHVSKFGKPIILSTGMSSIKEIDIAMYTLCNNEVILMQCTSTYPCAMKDVNLNVITNLRARYGILVGYSAHENSIVIPVIASHMGACVIEKHFTLDRAWKGSDQAGSLEVEGMRRMIRDIKVMRESLGMYDKKLLDVEIPIRHKLAKSVVSANPILAGQIITRNDLTTKCPGTGISPIYLQNMVGKITKNTIPADTLIKWEDIK